MGVVSILRLFLCVSTLKYNFHFVCTDFYIFLLVVWWICLVYRLDNWNVCVGMRMHVYLSESTCDGQKLILGVFPQIAVYLTYWDREAHASEAHGLCRVSREWVSGIVLSPHLLCSALGNHRLFGCWRSKLLSSFLWCEHFSPCVISLPLK